MRSVSSCEAQTMWTSASADSVTTETVEDNSSRCRVVIGHVQDCATVAGSPSRVARRCLGRVVERSAT